MQTGDGFTESMDIKTATLVMSGTRSSALMTKHAPKTVLSMELMNKPGETPTVLKQPEMTLSLDL